MLVFCKLSFPKSGIQNLAILAAGFPRSPQPLGARRAPNPPHRHLTWHPMTHPRDQNTFFLRFEHPHTLFYPFWALLEKSKNFIFFSKILNFFRGRSLAAPKFAAYFYKEIFNFEKFCRPKISIFFATVSRGN